VAPGLFTATDKDKNGSLSKAEFSGAFAIWFDEWDTGKTGLLNEERLRDGLSAALPQPATGGPGGPGEGRGPGGRGGGPGGGRDPATGATWSTPIVIATGGHEELIMSFPCRLAAYDPRTGKELWLSKGTGASIYASPVWGEDILIAMSSGPMGSSVIAVRPGGTGDVTENQRRWRLERIRSRIGSGVSHDGHFYSVSQEGIAECIDLKTGKTVWEKRLRGRGSRSSSWSSALLAGDRIFVPNQSGDVFVLRASPVCEVLAINSVGEPTNASLAASNGELFMRTDKALWCFSTAR
jgi:outer membrane protein assembly factor BamB